MKSPHWRPALGPRFGRLEVPVSRGAVRPFGVGGLTAIAWHDVVRDLGKLTTGCDQAGVEGVDDGCGPVAQPELGQHVAQVGFDGHLADV
jgi:hypothetical protein